MNWTIEGDVQLIIRDGENKKSVCLINTPFDEEKKGFHSRLILNAPKMLEILNMMVDVSDHKLENLNHFQLGNLMKDLRGEASYLLDQIGHEPL